MKVKASMQPGRTHPARISHPAASMLPGCAPGIRARTSAVALSPDPPISGESQWSRWIVQNLRPNGDLPDPHLGHNLAFQYQYAAFVLGQAVHEGKQFPSALTRRVLDRFHAIPSHHKRVSSEFNIFLLTLAWLYQEEYLGATEFTDRLHHVLKGIPIRSPEELLSHNNNYTAMACFVLDAWHRRGLPIQQEDAHLLRERFRSFQYDDGFFFDTTCRDNGGIPSLVYHAKMAAVALLQGILNEDEEFFERGKAGIDALLALCPVERGMAYGRSQNSLFGFANYYLALRLLGTTLGRSSYLQGAQQVAQLIDTLGNPTGEHGLNLSDRNAQRDGFDAYMYPVVYNVYAWAIRLLADALSPKSRAGVAHSSEEKKAPSTRVRYCGSSGFASVHHDRYGLYFNWKAYRQCQRYASDPRYACLVPSVVYAHGNVLVPSIPTEPIPPLFWGDEGLPARIRRRAFGLLTRLQGLVRVCEPDYASPLPFFAGRRSNLLALEPHDLSKSEDGIRAEFPLYAVSRLSPGGRGPAPATRRAVGSVRFSLRFDALGYDFRSHICLDQPFTGRLYHLNLRLPDLTFQSEPEDPGWYCSNGGVRWKHHPQPANVEWQRMPGSDAPVLYARAWSRCQGPLELETHTRIEFPEKADYV